jgi:beta-N-acetylhexosaminidase
MNRITFSSILALLAIVMLLGCGSETTDSEDTEVDIRGTIIELSRMEGSGNTDDAILGAVVVEGKIEEDTRYDFAAITIMSTTDIFRQEGQSKVPSTFDEVEQGQRVEVLFAGPVRETYPIQGVAAKLTILE